MLQEDPYFSLFNRPLDEPDFVILHPQRGLLILEVKDWKRQTIAGVPLGDPAEKSMRFTGKLKTWTDDRGFGFIAPTEGGQDIFVHISEYPWGRTPTINDVLSFEVALNAQGKKKAVRVRLASASPAPPPRPFDAERVPRAPPRVPRTNGSTAKTVVVLTMLALACWAGYRYYVQTTAWAISPTLLEQQRRARAVGLPEPKRATFECDGRTHCSQMTSCEEATFYLRNCPGTKMDGDHDGVPCEQQWCN